MIKNTTKHQKLGWVLFLAYLLALAYFLFFSEGLGRGSHMLGKYSYNLVPFKEIRRFFIYRQKLGMEAFFLNIVGNVAGFVPFGFFLPVVSRRSRCWYNTILLSFTFSLCIEITQLVTKVGSFDVDDMILNTLGGVLGFLLYRLVQEVRIRRRAGEKKS